MTYSRLISGLAICSALLASSGCGSSEYNQKLQVAFQRIGNTNSGTAEGGGEGEEGTARPTNLKIVTDGSLDPDGKQPPEGWLVDERSRTELLGQTEKLGNFEYVMQGPKNQFRLRKNNALPTIFMWLPLRNPPKGQEIKLTVEVFPDEDNEMTLPEANLKFEEQKADLIDFRRARFAEHGSPPSFNTLITAEDPETGTRFKMLIESPRYYDDPDYRALEASALSLAKSAGAAEGN